MHDEGRRCWQCNNPLAFVRGKLLFARATTPHGDAVLVHYACVEEAERKPLTVRPPGYDSEGEHDDQCN